MSSTAVPRSPGPSRSTVQLKDSIQKSECARGRLRRGHSLCAPEGVRRGAGVTDVLQPRRVHRLQGGDGDGRARPEAHLHQLRGAPAPDDAERVHQTDERFSKKVENHAAAIALYYIYYNFGRIHQGATRHSRDGGWRNPSRLERG